MIVLCSDWRYTCVVDWDAWFDSWEPIDKYFQDWRIDKEIFIPDTGQVPWIPLFLTSMIHSTLQLVELVALLSYLISQVWYNSGFICTRNTPWSGQFFERVVNALHDPCKKDEMGPGFLRDQVSSTHTLYTNLLHIVLRKWLEARQRWALYIALPMLHSQRCGIL